MGAFFADECPFLAGAVAYQIFFALIPLFALLIGGLGLIYGPDAAAEQFTALLRAVYPSVPETEARIVRELVDGRAVSFGLGLVGTILSATAIHGTIDSAIAVVLGREGKRAFVRAKLAAVVFILAIAGLAALSFAVSIAAQTAQDLLARLGVPPAPRLFIAVISPVIALIPGAAFFYAVYRLIPRQRVPRLVAARAALVSAVLWEVAKLGFALLARGTGAFQAYGALALAAGLLTWIYVSAAILLFGAEVIKTERRRG